MITNRRITRRHHLMAGAAAVALSVIGQAAYGQAAPNPNALPSGGTITAGNVTRQGGGMDNPGGAVGALIDAGNGGGAFTMNVNSAAAIVDWTNFDIGRNATVEFRNNTGGPVPFAVLNRVTSVDPTQIFGTLRGDNSVAANLSGSIWVVNPNGVIFGPQSSITNMSSFVASSLAVTDTEFDKFTTQVYGTPEGGVRFNGGTAGITLQSNDTSGASINVSGVVLLVAPTINMQGGDNPARITGSDVGFVVAQDASVRLDAGSLMRIGIAAGTTVANGQLLAAGTVNGQRIYAAAASQADVANILLNISGNMNATSAAMTPNGIVLRAGTADAAGAVPITMPAAGALNQAQNIVVADTAALTTTATGFVDLGGNGNLTLAGAQTIVAGSLTLASAGNMTLGTIDGVLGDTIATATGDLSVTNLSSGSDISLTGATVALGAGGLSAVDRVAVSATAGAITTAGGTIRSNSGNADTDATDRSISLSATGDVGSAGAAGPTLVTGAVGNAAKMNAVAITAGAGSAVALRNIDASTLTINPAGVSSISLGLVSLTAGLTLDSAGTIDLANLNARGAVDLEAAGAMTVTGISNTTGSVTLSGGSVAIGSSGISTQTSISVTATALVDGNITTSGGTLRSNSSNVDAGARGITLTAANGSVGTGSANLVQLVTGDTGTPASLDAISITAGASRAVTLGAITASGLTVNAAAGNIALGATNLSGGLALANAGSINIASLATGDSIDLNAAGLLQTGSLDNAAGTVTLRGSSIQVTDTTGLTVASATATGGNIVINATGPLAVTGDAIATGGSVSLIGAGVALGNNGAASSIMASDGVAINAGAGAITLGTQNVSITANSGNTASAGRTVNLEGDAGVGAGGGVLSIVAGNSQASGLAITVQRASGSAVQLGAVTGGNLSLPGVQNLGSIAVGDVLAFSGGISMTAGSITTGSLASRGSMGIVSEGALAFSTVRAGGGVTIGGGPLSVAATSIEANGNISITTPGAVNVITLATRGAALNAGLTAFDGAGGSVGNVSVTADSFGFAAASATGALSLTRTGGVIDTTGLTLSAGTALTLVSTAGATPGVILDQANRPTFGTNLTVEGPITANGGLSLAAPSGTIRFVGNATANGGLTLSGNSLELGTVTGAGAAAAISLTATTGNVTTGSVSSLAGLALSAGSQIITSGVTSFTATDAVSITGPVSINNGLTVSGAAVTMGNVVTRNDGAGLGDGDVAVAAATGIASVGSVASRGGVLVTAAADASVNGSVSTAAGGTYVVRAGSISLGTIGQSFTQNGAGGVLVQAATGGVNSLGTLTISAGAGNLVIDSAGAIAGGANLNNPGGAVLLRAGAGEAIALSSITADQLDNALIVAIPTELPSHYDSLAPGLLTGGAITLGTVTLTDPVSIRSTNGAVSVAGASSGGAVSIIANNGTLSVGVDAAITGSVSSTGDGPITLTSSLGTAIVRAGISTGTGAVNISAGSDVTLGRVGSTVAQGGGSVVVSATRQITGLGALTITAPSVSLGAGTLAPAGERSIGFGNGSAIAAGAGTVTVNRGINFAGLALGTVTTGSLNGLNTAITGAVDIVSLATSTGGINLASTGAMTIGVASSSHADGITLGSNMDLVLGQITTTGTNRPISLSGTNISLSQNLVVNGGASGSTGNVSSTGSLLMNSPGTINVAGDIITTGKLLTIDAGGALTVAGAIESGSVSAPDSRVVLRGSSIGVQNVTAENDIVVVATTGNIQGADFRVRPGSTDDASPALAGDQVTELTNPLSGEPIGPLTGRKVVLMAASELVAGYRIFGETSSDLVASVVNLGTVNQVGTLNVTGRRITGDDISADAGITLTTVGGTGLEPLTSGVFVDSLAASAGTVSVNSQLDIIVDGATTALGGISLIAARDVSLGGSLNANVRSVDGGALITISGQRGVAVATGIRGAGDVSITGGSAGAPAPLPLNDVALAGVESGGNVALVARRGLNAGAVTAAGTITASASNGNVGLGNLIGTELLVTTDISTGGSIAIASVVGAGGAPGATLLTASAVGSSVGIAGAAIVDGAINLTGGLGVTTGALTSSAGDAITIAASAGAVTTGNLIGGTVDVLGGGAVQIASVQGGGATIGAGSLLVTSSGSSVTLAGPTRVAGAVGIDAATSLTTDLVQGGTINLTARGGDIETQGLSGGDMLVQALAGNVMVAGVDGTGAVRIEATGNTDIASAINTSGGAAVTLRAGQINEPDTMGAISGAGSLTTQDVNAGGIAIVLQANNGNISTGALTGSAVTATASGAAPLGNTSIASIAINGLGPTLVQSTGNTTVTGATISQGPVTLRAGQIGETGATNTIVAAGNLNTGSIDAGSSAITLRAANGDVTSGALTGGMMIAEATGSAPAGDVTLASATGGSIAIQAAGTARLQAASTLTGTAAIGAGAIETAAVTAGIIGFTGVSSVDTGALIAPTISVSASAGSVDVASAAGSTSVLLQATGGNVESGAITGGAITANASGTGANGNVTIASVNAGSLNVSASTLATLQTASTLTGTATIGAGAINTAAVTAGSIGFTGVSSVDTGALIAPTISVSASAGSVDVASAAGSTSVLLQATGGNVESGAITGGAITANASGAGANGNVTIASVNAGSLNVSASNLATLQTASTFTGAATIGAGAIDTAAVTAGSIGFTGASSVDTALLSAPNINVRATAGTVNIATISNSGTVLVQASGNTTIGDIGANGAVIVRAGQVDATAGTGNLETGFINAGIANITLRATNGSITTGILTGGILQAQATGTAGDILIERIASSSQATLTAGRNITLSGDLASSGAAALTASGSITLQSVSNAGSLAAGAGGAIAMNGDASVADAITLDAAGDITTANLDSRNNAAVAIRSTTGNLDLGQVSGGLLTLTADAGNAVVNQITRGTDLDIAAGGTATVTNDSSVTGAATITADTISTAALDAASIGLAGTSSVNTGALTAAIIDVRASAGSVNVASAAGTSSVVLAATNGNVTSGIITGGAITATANGAAPNGNVTIAAVDAGSLAITASNTATLSNDGRLATTATIGADVITTQAVDAGSIGFTGASSVVTGALSAGSIDVRATAGTATIASIGGSGTVLVQASGDTGVGAINATGPVTLRAGQVDAAAGAGNLTASTISAGTEAITLQATNGNITTDILTGGAVLATASGTAPAGNVTIAAVNAASLGVTASNTATLAGDSVLSTAATIAANAISTAGITAGSIGLTGLNTVVTGNLTAGSIDVRATGGTTTVASVSGSGTVLVQASGNNSIGAINATGPVTLRAGQVDGTAGAGNLVADAINAGTAAITLRATDGNITTGALSGGAILVDATGASPAGNITLATAAGASLGMTASNAATLSNDSSVTGAAIINAGTISTAAVTAGSIGFTAVGNAATGTLSAGSIDVRATAGAVNVAGVRESGTVLVQASADIAIGAVGTTGAVTLRAGQVDDVAGAGNLQAGAITAGTAAITVRATNGNVATGALSGGALLASATGAAPAGNVTLAAATGASLGITASNTATLQGASSLAGAATIGAGAIATQAVTAGSIAFTAATGTTTGALTATSGTVDVRTTGGAATTGSITGASSVLVQASNNATTGAVNAAGSVTMRAGQVGATGAAGTITGAGNLVTAAITAAGTSPIDLRANGGSITTGGLAGGAIAGNATGNSGNITIAGISRTTGLTLASGGTVSFTANVRVNGQASLTANRVDLGTGAELRTDGTILLRANSGSTPVNVANGTGSLFDNEDMPRVFAPALRIDGLNRNVTIGTTDLFPAIANVGITTTGDIDVIGALSFRTASGTARTLTLGGDAVADSSANAGLATQARSVAVRVQNAGSTISGGRIIADGSVVRLNAQFVAVGQATTPAPAQLAAQGGLFGDRVLGSAQAATAESARGDFTENPGSPFYRAFPAFIPPGYTVVAADKLVVRVQQWGLLQNTDTAAQPGGGVNLNNVQLLAAPGGPANGPIVGFFGSLGGQEGIAAALRVTVDQLGGISPNNVRINGCVALTTAGCIVTGLPLPLVQLNDPNRSLLIRSTPELVLPVELISGTTNEALWRDDEQDDPALPAVPATEGVRP